MEKLKKGFYVLFLSLGITGLILCTTSQITASRADSSKEGAYQEVKKDGRIYIFSSEKRKEEFGKSGELGKGIIKIGHGPNGETVIFDSDEAIIEYESYLVKEILGNSRIKAYREFKKDDRVYVFTSPTRKKNFEKSGELGVGIVKIGYGPHGETVIFDSDEAVKKYDDRHSKNELISR